MIPTSVSIRLLAMLFVFAASATAHAEDDKLFRAYVVSVDTNAKSITLRHTDDNKLPKWVELVAKWDDTTKWEREEPKYKQQPATVDLAAKLTPETKVYVDVNDHSTGKEWWLKSLSTMTADSTVN